MAIETKLYEFLENVKTERLKNKTPEEIDCEITDQLGESLLEKEPLETEHTKQMEILRAALIRLKNEPLEVV